MNVLFPLLAVLIWSINAVVSKVSATAIESSGHLLLSLGIGADRAHPFRATRSDPQLASHSRQLVETNDPRPAGDGALSKPGLLRRT